MTLEEPESKIIPLIINDFLNTVNIIQVDITEVGNTLNKLNTLQVINLSITLHIVVDLTLDVHPVEIY